MDFTNVTKSFEMTSILNYRKENLKTADIETRKTKTQKGERRKPSFTKKIDRKCRIIRII